MVMYYGNSRGQIAVPRDSFRLTWLFDPFPGSLCCLKPRAREYSESTLKNQIFQPRIFMNKIRGLFYVGLRPLIYVRNEALPQYVCIEVSRVISGLN